MSLLMEALKKAERAKQAQEQGAKTDAAAGEVDLQLAPDHPDPPAIAADADAATASAEGNAPAEEPARIPARDLPRGRADFPKLELESIDDREFELDPVKPRAPRPAAAPATDTEARSRAAARAVFEAKLPEAAAANRMPLIMGTVVVVAVLGIGGYFLMQVLSGPGGLVNPQKVSGQLAQRGAAPPQAPATTPATPSPSAAPPMLTSAPSGAVAPAPSTAPPAPAVTQSASLSVAQSPTQRSIAAATSADGPTRTERTTERPVVSAPAKAKSPPRNAVAAANQERGSGALRVSPPTLAVDPALDDAYRAYLANDAATARNRYRAVLDADAGNRDALLGLAGLAARERRLDEAESYYLRVLQSDPTDAYAQAGLIAIRSQTDPVAAESRMKTLVANHPDAAFLHHALGNFYAKQGRWNEAQQEHFRAFAIEADNPDYCYNLAVSLDQIRQPQLALAHYQRALALSASRPASFDPGQLRARISDLQKP